MLVIRARHGVATCLAALGRLAAARAEFDACAEVLEGADAIPEDVDGLHGGATPALLQARAFYHGAVASDWPALDPGVAERLLKAEARVPAPPAAAAGPEAPAASALEAAQKKRREKPASPKRPTKWPGRPEDATLGALVQLALARQALRDASKGGFDHVQRTIVRDRLDAARRYAAVVSTRLGDPTTATLLLDEALATATARERLAAGDPKGACDAYPRPRRNLPPRTTRLRGKSTS